MPEKTERRAKSVAGGRVEQVVAPFDRRAQRPLALGRVAGTARQDGERRVEPLEKPLGREQLRPRRGELDGEREAVEAAADLLHRRVGSDLAPDRPGALDEERGGLLLREAGRAGTPARPLRGAAPGS